MPVRMLTKAADMIESVARDLDVSQERCDGCGLHRFKNFTEQKQHEALTACVLRIRKIAKQRTNNS